MSGRGGCSASPAREARGARGCGTPGPAVPGGEGGDAAAAELWQPRTAPGAVWPAQRNQASPIASSEGGWQNEIKRSLVVGSDFFFSYGLWFFF